MKRWHVTMAESHLKLEKALNDLEEAGETIFSVSPLNDMGFAGYTIVSYNEP